jgi:hypothetical protein
MPVLSFKCNACCHHRHGAIPDSLHLRALYIWGHNYPFVLEL